MFYAMSATALDAPSLRQGSSWVPNEASQCCQECSKAGWSADAVEMSETHQKPLLDLIIYPQFSAS